MYPICASSGFALPNDDPDSYGKINTAGTPFPGSSNNTEFSDNTIPSAKSWNGRNTNRELRNISEEDLFVNFSFVGRPDVVFNVPYSYDFSDANNFRYYKTIDANGDLRTWLRTTNSGQESASIMHYLNNSPNPADDWLISPAIILETGKTYRLSFSHKVRYDENVYTEDEESLKIFIGKSNTIAALDREIFDLPAINNHEQFEMSSVDFKVYEDNVYYFGFYCYSGDKKWELYLDNISVELYSSIDEFDNFSKINVYPNPTNDKLYFSTENLNLNNLNEIKITKIELQDFSGRILKTFDEKTINNFDNSTNEIDISDLVSGSYILIFHTFDEIFYRKIIKK
jgi:hypothetical protein